MKNTLKNIFTIIVFMFIIVSFSGCFNNSEKHKNEIKEEIKKELEEENESLRKSNTIIVFLNDGLSADDIALIKSKLEAVPGFESMRYTSKEEALEEAKEKIKDNKGLMEQYTPTVHPFPASFSVVLKDKSYCDGAKNIIEDISGVKAINVVESN